MKGARTEQALLDNMTVNVSMPTSNYWRVHSGNTGRSHVVLRSRCGREFGCDCKAWEEKEWTYSFPIINGVEACPHIEKVLQHIEATTGEVVNGWPKR